MLDIKINRRIFIGASVFVVSAPLLSTSLSKENTLYKVMENGQFFDANELTVLMDVAQIMIPKTHTPGAEQAEVASVLDGLMLTWASKKTQKQYKECIATIQSIALDTYQQAYIDASLNQRTKLIEQLDIRAFENQTSVLSASYRKLKEIIFHIYYTSEEANPDFVLIPGGYRGCLSKDELEKIHARGYL